jgi:hypothetical protein
MYNFISYRVYQDEQIIMHNNYISIYMIILRSHKRKGQGKCIHSTVQTF